MPEDRPSRPKRRSVDFDELGYPLFSLVRDPSLVPANRRRSFQAQLSAVERIRGEIVGLQVLAGLTPQQQMEVAALVADIDSEYQQWCVAATRLPRLKLMSKRGPGHVRMLAKKLNQASAALRNIANHAAKLDSNIEERIAPHVQEALRAVDLAKGALIGPRETVDQYTGRMRGRHEDALSYMPQGDPRPSAAGRLVQYFRRTVSSNLDDAHVRVATLGKARWGWDYTISRNSYGKRQCPALRKVIDRAKDPTRKAASQPSTSRKRTPNKKPR